MVRRSSAWPWSPDAVHRSHLACIAFLCIVCPSLRAANVDVQVRDTAGKPLNDAVVFLESAAAKAAAKPVTGTEVAQAARQFVPSVTVVSTGSSLLFPNRDSVRHHVYSFSPAKTFELKLYTGTPANPVLFDKPGVVVLGCNIHDHMAAWVLVVDTPYFGKTSADGVVKLSNIPPGSYRLRAWHAGLPVGVVPQDQALVLTTFDATASVALKGVTQ
jgi:plastocyanin